MKMKWKIPMQFAPLNPWLEPIRFHRTGKPIRGRSSVRAAGRGGMNGVLRSALSVPHPMPRRNLFAPNHTLERLMS
jgi:hypothetical protein